MAYGPGQKKSRTELGSTNYIYTQKLDVTSQPLVQKPLSMILAERHRIIHQPARQLHFRDVSES